MRWQACKKNWNITIIKDGPCDSSCHGEELGNYNLKQKYYKQAYLIGSGGYSADGSFTASNKGHCIQDYFRCAITSRNMTSIQTVNKNCCIER